MGLAERSSILLLLIVLPGNLARSEVCYRCANEFIIMYWGRFLPIQADDELVADQSCTKIAEKTEIVRCDGPCMSVNVTTIGEGNKTRTVGMMRDCQKKYYTWNHYTGEEHRSCRNRTVKIRRHTLNAQYCFCLGSFCNGGQLMKPDEGSRKIAKHKRIRGRLRSRGSNFPRLFLCNMQVLIFVFGVFLKFHSMHLLL